DYAKQRVQFDRPIGSFQAVKHRAADMLLEVESLRSAVYYAAWALERDHPDASLAASMAKAYASDAYRKVAAGGIQIHGGIGFTWEADLHLYFKRAKASEVAFGDASRRTTPDSEAAVVDVSDRAAVEQLCADVLERHGKVDVLVNNAGIPLRKHATRLTVEDVEQVMRINFFGAVYPTLALLPSMLE